MLKHQADGPLILQDSVFFYHILYCNFLWLWVPLNLNSSLEILAILLLVIVLQHESELLLIHYEIHLIRNRSRRSQFGQTSFSLDQISVLDILVIQDALIILIILIFTIKDQDQTWSDIILLQFDQIAWLQIELVFVLELPSKSKNKIFILSLENILAKLLQYHEKVKNAPGEDQCPGDPKVYLVYLVYVVLSLNQKHNKVENDVVDVKKYQENIVGDKEDQRPGDVTFQ